MPSDYANDLIARVGLDTTEWKKGITDLNSGIKHIETGFQATAALMDDWSNSSEGLKKRIETLNDKLALQKKKLDTLKQAYEEEVNANGEGSKGAEELAKKMFDAEKEIRKTSKSIEYYSDKLANEAVKAQKEFIEKLEQSEKKLKSVGDGLTNAGKKLTAGITAPVVAAGVAVYKYSSDLNEAKNKAEQTFGYAADGVKEWAESSLEAFGMAKSTALDAVSLYGDMATSMDIGKNRASEMSTSLVELSADIASFKNTSIEQAQNALKGIFTGETESLKNLGIVMTETELKAYALSKGITTSYSELSQAEKVNLRYEFVLEKSKNAIGDYSRTSGEAAAQMRKLPEALKELASSFEENVEPVITPIITGLNNAIVSFGKMDESGKKTVTTIALLGASIGPLLTVGGKAVTVAGKIKGAIAWVKKGQLAKSATTTATALTATETASAGAATGITAVGTAAKTAVPILLAVSAALIAVKAIADKYEENRNKAIDKKYDKLIEKSNKSYDKEIENINAELKTYENAQNQKIYDTQVYYDNLIKKATEYEQAEKKNIEKTKEALKQAHDIRLAQLKEEYDAQLALLEQKRSSATAELQAQIDAIDALTSAEDEAEKERSNKEKLKELEENILNASSLTERQQAQKAYSDFVAQLEKEQTLKKREQEKARLQNQIETINEEINAEKTKLETEYNATVDTANKEYEAEVKDLDNRLEALEGYADREAEILEEKKNTAIEKMQNETQAYIDELEKRLEELQKAKEKEEEILNSAKKKEKETLYEPQNIQVPKSSNKKFNEVQSWLSGLPGNASGTDFWRGGLTRINEEGGEILNLPRGTQIIPHDVSVEAAKEYARAVTNNTNSNNHTSNTYNYGAQQHVTKVEIGGRSVGEIIEPTVSNIMAIKIEQRKREGHAY